MISIWSKPTSLFHAFCSSIIRKRRVRSSLCDTASSLTRMRSRMLQHVASNSLIILRTSRSLSGKVIFFQKQIKTEYETLVLLRAALPRAPSKSPDSLSISALATLLRTGAFLRSALDRWRLGNGAQRCSLNPADVPLSCPSLGWVRGIFSHLRLASRGCCSNGALVALRRPMVHTGASSRRSRPFPRPVIFDVPALLSWHCRQGR